MRHKNDSDMSTAHAIDSSAPFILGEWRIDPIARTATRGDEIAKIDPRNMRVLQILVERHGQVVSQRELESLAWEGVVVTPDSLYQSIRQLRQVLQDTKAPAKYIETVPRRGYRMVAEPRVDGKTSPVPPFEAGLASPPTTSFRSAIQRALNANHLAITALIILASATFLHSSLQSPPDPVANTRSTLTEDPIKVGTSVGVSDSPSRSPERAYGASFRVLRALGTDSLQAGRPHEALEYFKQALQRQISDAGENNESALRVLAEIANVYLWLDDEAAAYESAAKALAIANQLGPALSTERIWSVTVITNVLVALGQYSRADPLITETINASKKYLGARDPSLLNAFCALALLRFAQVRLPEAEQAAREAEASAIHLEGAQSIHVANAKALIAAILVERKAFKEAEREARLVIDIASRYRSSGPHPYEISAKHMLAEALMGQEQYARAEILLNEELAALEEARAVDWRLGRAASALGEVYLRIGNRLEAERYLFLAKSKLTRTTGWPIEREIRNLARRLEELNALRPKQVSALTN
jgi:DNA-binding winged helix-turn-helix (wHTH) protein